MPDVGYLHDEVGYNYRLTNLAAALGLAQLERLDEFVDRKRRIAARYDEALAGTGLVAPPRVAGSTPPTGSTRCSSRGRPPRTRRPPRAPRAHGIGARALWRPLHAQPPFAAPRSSATGRCRDLFQRGVSLPCATELTEADQERVIAAVRSHWG